MFQLNGLPDFEFFSMRCSPLEFFPSPKILCRVLAGFFQPGSRKTMAYLAMALACTTVNAQSFMEDMIDPEDGWVDGGKFLLEYPYAVLPVPIIITEPAGYPEVWAFVIWASAGSD